MNNSNLTNLNNFTNQRGATVPVTMTNSESRISNYSTNNLNQYMCISLGKTAAPQTVVKCAYDSQGCCFEVVIF